MEVQIRGCGDLIVVVKLFIVKRPNYKLLQYTARLFD